MDNPGHLQNRAGGRLFVYGTLRKGFRSHGLLLRCRPRFLGKGHVCGELYDFGEYPGAAEGKSEWARVEGELYWLPRAEVAFKVLDSFEGYDHTRPALDGFERKETIVSMANGDEIRAWIYWLSRKRASGHRIPSGNYAQHPKWVPRI
ncbi:MAG TPA: gamma-glutamylcyclotransferase family protein [Terriglobia bacterium]|nr:gamma-glutamylcyclotransferase family protein [Terriglobia bacterium]